MSSWELQNCVRRVLGCPMSFCQSALPGLQWLFRLSVVMYTAKEAVLDIFIRGCSLIFCVMGMYG